MLMMMSVTPVVCFVRCMKMCTLEDLSLTGVWIHAMRGLTSSMLNNKRGRDGLVRSIAIVGEWGFVGI